MAKDKNSETLGLGLWESHDDATIKQALMEDAKVNTKVAFVGVTGSGKTSLYNAMFQREIGKVGGGGIDETVKSKPTKVASGLSIIDTPGYGGKLYPMLDRWTKAHADIDICVSC